MRGRAAGIHQDHPRSRGVYKLAEVATGMTGGSSPLARGLLQGWIDKVNDAGDHPRSRGVYGSHAGTATHLQGSSPLARGLPMFSSLKTRTIRIIPARAGFTKKTPSGALVARDHPRSRGVYSIRIASCEPRSGSSPLARGLPPPRDRCQQFLRIIPARAGFTSFPHGQRRNARDHPRSRGVYRPVGVIGLALSGSSPLARGLRSPTDPSAAS